MPFYYIILSGCNKIAPKVWMCSKSSVKLFEKITEKFSLILAENTTPEGDPDCSFGINYQDVECMVDYEIKGNEKTNVKIWEKMYGETTICSCRYNITILKAPSSLPIGEIMNEIEVH